LSALRGEAAAAASTLTVAEVDAALAGIAATSARVSKRPCDTTARPLRSRHQGEQDFLVRLLVGELRQGALEGVMIDAVAAAAALPAAPVRRAAMLLEILRWSRTQR